MLKYFSAIDGISENEEFEECPYIEMKYLVQRTPSLMLLYQIQ